jgi:ferric-dicitrate binding protein FerR (iron transport regulator)
MEASINEMMNELIGRCLQGIATDTDRAELEQWIQSSPGNLTYFRQMKNLWEVSDNPIYYTEDDLEKILAQVFKQAAPARPELSWWSVVQKAAAILLLPLIAGSFLWGRYAASGPVKRNHDVVYNEVFAAYGTRSAISLADGSRVWLNSGSSLKYPDRFTGRKREVYLKGEAYFEVKSDAKSPFLVHTRPVTVKATGTKFNVLASGDEPQAEITLVSGKVDVTRNREGRAQEVLSSLKPSEHMDYDTLTGEFQLLKGDTYKYIAWKDGKLIFRNEPFADVMDKISHFYNVDIELRSKKLREYRYRATFEEESFSEILKLLKLSSPIEYMELKRLPLPDGTFPKRKVIIMARTNAIP